MSADAAPNKVFLRFGQRVVCLYFPREMWAELHAEAKRQDRQITWLIRQAWKKARGKIRSMAAAAGDPVHPVASRADTPIGRVRVRVGTSSR